MEGFMPGVPVLHFRQMARYKRRHGGSKATLSHNEEVRLQRLNHVLGNNLHKIHQQTPATAMTNPSLASFIPPLNHTDETVVLYWLFLCWFVFAKI